MIDALSEQEVLDISFPIWRMEISGIYFLIEGDEVVYVGKSRRMVMRINAHLMARQMIFDRIAFVLCDPNNLAEMEAHYIRTFKPVHNLREEKYKAPRLHPLPDSRNIDRLMLKPPEAADYLTRNFFPTTLNALTRMRRTHNGPKAVRWRGRYILYRREALDEWGKSQQPDNYVKPRRRQRTAQT